MSFSTESAGAAQCQGRGPASMKESMWPRAIHAFMPQALSGLEASLVGDRGGLAGAMKDADDDQLAAGGQVIDGVGTMEGDTQARGKLLARRADERREQQRGEFRLDGIDKERGDGFRCFGGDVRPNFRQIGLGRIRQSEDERAANSFLPRSTIFLVSKSVTRPAATSARPLSMSALSAASS